MEREDHVYYINLWLGSHTVIRGRCAQPPSASGSEGLKQRFCQWRWKGKCLCSCCSQFFHPCFCIKWRPWHPSCPVVLLPLSSTDREFHVNAAVGWSFSAWWGLGGCHHCLMSCQRLSCIWPCWAPPQCVLHLALSRTVGIRWHKAPWATRCPLWSRGASNVSPISVPQWPNQNQIQLVPVPWMPVSPRDFVLRFCLEVGVSDTKVVESTELKQSLTDDFHSFSLLQTGTPRGAMS